MTILIVINTTFVDKIRAKESSPPTLNSEAAILMDANSGEIFYEKNADVSMYPASLTKIATAIYAIENGKLDDMVTVSKNATKADGTTVFLEEGEQVPLKKLIQGLLINSGNDAGTAIAEHLSGSVEQFSKDLNAYFKNVIGIENTHYTNPHGLFNENHVTTAEDLAKMTQYAIKNETFMEIFSEEELEWNGKSWDTTIQTHHKLVKGEYPYKGITGGKNGFVSQSGYTLATTAERGNLNLVVVTLKSTFDDEAYEDTMKLLDYGFNNFETSSIDKGTTFMHDEQEFITPEKYFYSYAKGDQLQEEVSDNGMLEVKNQDNEVIASFQLDKITRESTAIKSAAEESDNRPFLERVLSQFSYLSILGVIVIVGLIFVLIRKLMKKKKANKYFF